jgi:DNA-directed RNA polymerase specialized sigma24 family protein
VIDEYRRRSNKPPLVDLDAIAFDDAEDGGSRTAGETAIADDLSPHELAECSHTCRQVQHAISQLRDDQGYVVQRRMDGYEYTEIAAELGKSNGAAKQLNTRAFANLRTALQEAL